jgi:oxaloacetate decarboxylase gamma subunit
MPWGIRVFIRGGKWEYNMTIVEMLQQSAILTVLGMAVVFIFLWIMIVCINSVGKLVHNLGWDKDVQGPNNGTPNSAAGTVTPEVTAAISVAVTEYREKRPEKTTTPS